MIMTDIIENKIIPLMFVAVAVVFAMGGFQ